MKLVYKVLSLCLVVCLSLVIAPFHISADSGFDYDNYYELNYIESTGTQYINTGVIRDINTRVYLDVYVSSFDNYGSLSSMGKSGDSNGSYELFYKNGSSYEFRLGSSTYTFNPTLNTRYKIDFNNNRKLYIDDSLVYTFNISSFSAVSKGLPLFASQWDNNSNIYYSSARLYECIIYDSSTEIRHFIPAERKSDNVIGLYDIVNGVFYNNNGSGTFLSGGRKPLSYTLTLSVSPEGSGSVLNGGIYEYGDVVQIGAIPNNGYEFSSWSDGNTDNPRSITITDNVTFTANFVVSSGGSGGDNPDPPNPPDPPVGDFYTVSGSVYPSGSGTVVGLGRYESGTVVTVSASANQGYHFNSWSDGSTQNPRTYTVTSNINVVANFDYDNSTVSNNPVIGINANVIGIDTYGDSITLPRINYIPNSTTGTINGYLVSTNNNNSVYDLGSSSSVSGNANGLTVTFNIGGYLTSNSNIGINNLTKVLTEYEFILDNYYRGTVVISDGTNQYTRYVNGNRFIFNSSSSDLTVQSFTVESYNLEQNSMANNIDILVNGTNSSNTSVSDLNTTDSQFNDSANDLIDYEDGFNTDMNNALQNIDTDFNFSTKFGSKFLASAEWVKIQFNHLTGDTPFGSVLSFSLLLGLALLLVGKMFR